MVVINNFFVGVGIDMDIVIGKFILFPLFMVFSKITFVLARVGGLAGTGGGGWILIVIGSDAVIK